MKTEPEQLPLGISELVRRIGDENIQFQNVLHNLSGVQNPRHGKHSTITMTIAPDIGQELASATMASQTPRKTGLLLWIDTDKIKKAMEQEADTRAPSPVNASLLAALRGLLECVDHWADEGFIVLSDTRPSKTKVQAARAALVAMKGEK